MYPNASFICVRCERRFCYLGKGDLYMIVIRTPRRYLYIYIMIARRIVIMSICFSGMTV